MADRKGPPSSSTDDVLIRFAPVKKQILVIGATGNQGRSVIRALGKRVAHVAKLADVSHLVYSSVGGADRNADVSYFRSKRRIEYFIRELDLENYTLLRPVAFIDNFAAGYRDVATRNDFPCF